jgi:hypothetical protein
MAKRTQRANRKPARRSPARSGARSPARAGARKARAEAPARRAGGPRTAAQKGRRKPTDLGANRTGVDAAPLRAREMVRDAESVPADPAGAASLALARGELSQEAPPVGSMPLPGSLRGAAKALGKAITGEKATVYLDRLGERLAFERTGVRLYDAVLAKLPASRLDEGSRLPGELMRFRDEELAHLHLVREAIEAAGGDPTAVTPCADLAGVRAQGIVSVLTDPRTTLTQCLDALLTVELADNDGWKVLIALSEASGQPEVAERFTAALAEEDRHLEAVRGWIAERLGIQLGRPLPSTDFGEPRRPGV